MRYPKQVDIFAFYEQVEGGLLERIPVMLGGLSLLIGILIVGSAFFEPITAFVQRHYPNFSGDAELFLLWGGLILAAFAFGLLVMYLALHP